MMNAAAQRKDSCLSAPATIKGAALSKVGVKLAKLGLAREIEEPKAQFPKPYRREVAVFGTPHMPGGFTEIRYEV